MKKFGRKALTAALALSMLATLNVPSQASAAAKPKLSTKKVSVTVGAKKKVTVKGKKVKKTTWSVKSKKVATLSSKKKTSVTITGKKVGSTTLTAKVKVGKKVTKLTAKITVKKANDASTKPAVTPSTAPSVVPSTVPTTAPSNPPVNNEKASSIELDRETLNMAFNANIQINATILPEGAANNTITWKSDDEAVASVSQTGMVKGNGNGTTTITATVDGVSDSFTVSVVKANIGQTVINWDGSDGTVGPWKQRAAGTEPTVLFNSTDGRADDGNTGCFQVTDRSSNAQGALIDMSENMEPSATYKFTAWVKLKASSIMQEAGQGVAAQAAVILSSETRACAAADESYANLKCITTKKANWGCAADYILKDPTQWNQVVYEVTTPDDVSHFGLYFECGNNVDSDILVDDTTLTLVSRNQPDYTLENLKDVYAGIFKHVGVGLGYDSIMGENAATFASTMFNSMSAGNEMKPDAILPGENSEANFYTAEEAKAAGYATSDAYEACDENMKSKSGAAVPVYPKLNFTKVDQILKQAYDKGTGIRFHTLVWHQQTPVHFFKAKYKSALGAANASTTTMDERLKFYIKTVMNHVLESPYASVVYTVDVANEYLHSHNADSETVNTNGVTFWEKIYNTFDESTGRMSTQPSYVKLAFETTHDVLVAHNRTDISLMYNDYNEYDTNITNDAITMINWINGGETDKTKWICQGIGMQSHLDLSNPSVATYTTALDKFRAAGLEIQVTELDITNYSGTGAEDIAKEKTQYKAIMNALIDCNKKGGNVTSVTFWSLYDAVSWRASGRPCIFDGLFSAKDSYYGVIEAAKESQAN